MNTPNLQTQSNPTNYTNTIFKGETAADAVTGMLLISKPLKGSIVPFVAAATGADDSFQVAIGGSNSSNFTISIGNYHCNGCNCNYGINLVHYKWKLIIQYLSQAKIK